MGVPPRPPAAVPDRAREALEAIREETGAQGALLVKSDGVCAAAAIAEPADPALLAALSATGLGALRLGLLHLGLHAEETIFVEAGDRQLVLHPIDGAFLLVVLARPPRDARRMREALRDAAARLAAPPGPQARSLRRSTRDG